MPFLNKTERDLVKKVLSDVMTDDDVKEQFNKAKTRKEGVVSDYTDAMLGQYMGILKDITAEREERKGMNANIPPGPDLKTLKKKYLGPKK